MNGKFTGSNADKSRGVELGASVVFSSAVTSQVTASFRRVFRVSSLDVAEMGVVPDPKTNAMRRKAMNMSLAERADMHTDFSGFEFDDNDVGDGVLSFYANGSPQLQRLKHSQLPTTRISHSSLQGTPHASFLRPTRSTLVSRSVITEGCAVRGVATTSDRHPHGRVCTRCAAGSPDDKRNHDRAQPRTRRQACAG